MQNTMTTDLNSNGNQDSAFVWQDERLQNASRDDLVDHIADLQDRMQDYETEVADLRETLYFLLDLQVGSVDPEDVIESQVRGPDER